MENSYEFEEEEIELEEGQEQKEVGPSIEDAINQAFEEAKSNENAETDTQNLGNQGQKPAEAAAKAEKPGKKGKRKTIEGAELEKQPTEAIASQEEEIRPPQRFTLEMKERFNQYPPELKKQYLKDWGEVESQTTKLWQDWNRELGKNREINQIVDHYIPKWGVQGMTPQAAVAEMFAMQDRIIQDPLAAYTLMLEKSGITPEMLYEYRENRGATQQPARPQFQQQEQNNFLTKEQLYETMQEWQAAQQEQFEVQSAASEVQALKDSMSADGRYLYPELHDNAQIERVKPLVDSLLKTHSGLSFGEATKQAVQALRYLYNSGSPSQNASRFPTNNNQQNINKAKAASVSVTGRGSASKPTNIQNRKDVSIDDAIEATFAALSENF